MAATESLYASKIIKAGALLSDTKTLLAHWDDSSTTRIIYTVFSTRTSSARHLVHELKTFSASSASDI